MNSAKRRVSASRRAVSARQLNCGGRSNRRAFDLHGRTGRPSPTIGRSLRRRCPSNREVDIGASSLRLLRRADSWRLTKPAAKLKLVTTRPQFAAAPMNEVTRILSAVEQGDPQAAEQLLPLVYYELRKLAAHGWPGKPGQTLEATALVHEAYLRLVGGDDVQQEPDCGPYSGGGRGHGPGVRGTPWPCSAARGADARDFRLCGGRVPRRERRLEGHHD